MSNDELTWHQQALAQGLQRALAQYPEDVRIARAAALARQGTLHKTLAQLSDEEQQRLAAQIGETPWIF